MSKNIVIFSDGTGQEGGEGPDTNVYRLFRAVENRTSNQIAFYDRGLGTGRRWLAGKAAGAGIGQNILECYQFIFENFEAGDKIFLFGFSRGAATVRSLSGFIHLFGVLPKSRPELILKAYKIYRIKDAVERAQKAAAFSKRHNTMWVRIKFLGVWDTVAALGAPFKALNKLVEKLPMYKHSFHDFTLSESVEYAYHALSIDDERLSFHPVLWDEKLLNHQKMEQVWFLGVHTDVGGGYKENELSNIAFKWMLDKSIQAGLKIYSSDASDVQGDANGHMHDPQSGKFSKYYRRQKRIWPKRDNLGNVRGKPSIHPTVFERTLGKDNSSTNEYSPWIFEHIEGNKS